MVILRFEAIRTGLAFESSGRNEGAAVKIDCSRTSNAELPDTTASVPRTNRPVAGARPWRLVSDGRLAVMGL